MFNIVHMLTLFMEMNFQREPKSRSVNLFLCYKKKKKNLTCIEVIYGAVRKF